MRAVTPYRELPPPRGLERQLACVWRSHDRAVRVLPDACVDIVWDRSELVVAGPATRATQAPATPGQARCGVRFRVGAAGAGLRVPASELLDQRVPLRELWARRARRLEDRLAAAPTIEAALDALVEGVADALDPRPDPLVRQAALELTRGSSLAQVCRLVELGERQLRRRFHDAVGYGPATLVRVQRFQRFLSAAEEAPETPLARLAADAGYADQAHLTRESRRLAGVSPAALVLEGAMSAGDKSVLFKPPGMGFDILAA